MLARIPKRTISLLLLFAGCVAFVGCATQQHVALVDDPDAHGESQMPWNKQEKWENQQSNFTGMTDHR
jgi:hypothetical protein